MWTPLHRELADILAVRHGFSGGLKEVAPTELVIIIVNDVCAIIKHLNTTGRLTDG